MSAPKASHQRLQKEYIKINRDPPPYIRAVPLPNNILEWHYVITGPEDSVYAGGFYHGKLLFPQDYPFKPPSIVMITPSGRFQCNTRLCLSLSDFHPEQWHPGWSVASILIGLLSFMLENTPTTGSIETSDAKKRELARSSVQFNLANPKFVKLFPELWEKLEAEQNVRQSAANALYNQRLQQQSQNGDNQTNRVGGGVAGAQVAPEGGLAQGGGGQGAYWFRLVAVFVLFLALVFARFAA
eukprot:comp13349_c0_seq1/m.8793 comp13349_c0_seq1/g.8793  ORF comp13349_c0_seq1/g.8793 comp13349_c0_seq1/m.8793 type:complete len:241 (-) comp13349_c0_seq1:326-1048(-)